MLTYKKRVKKEKGVFPSFFWNWWCGVGWLVGWVGGGVDNDEGDDILCVCVCVGGSGWGQGHWCGSDHFGNCKIMVSNWHVLLVDNR